MDLQQFKEILKYNCRYVKGVPFVDRRYTKGVPLPFRSKMVNKRVRGWTSGRSLSYKTLLSTLPPAGGITPVLRYYRVRLNVKCNY